MTAVLGTLPTPSFLSMLAHRYPLHEQALHTLCTRTARALCHALHAHAPRCTRTACQAHMHGLLHARVA